ncbi:hypothetical protein BJ166DRAFT_358311 [Pestalotiopsis sp. NC0098]|nr:hypothetical protein BJ166DRAFT_358311 [Pestalotiopsis sp. NC0098]
MHCLAEGTAFVTFNPAGGKRKQPRRALQFEVLFAASSDREKSPPASLCPWMERTEKRSSELGAPIDSVVFTPSRGAAAIWAHVSSAKKKNSAAAWSFVPYNGATAMANRDDRRLDYSACMSRETRYSDQGPPALLVPTQTTPCREQLLCSVRILSRTLGIRQGSRLQIIYSGIPSRTGQDEFPIGSSSCMGFPPFGAIACM